MAWTAPRTWTTGELVTAAVMNTHVRDNLSYLKDNKMDYAAAQSQPARAKDTTYQNTTGKPVMVTISFSNACQIKCDGSSPPTTIVAAVAATGCITIVVQPTYYYRAEGVSCTINYWTEYALG